MSFTIIIKPDAAGDIQYYRVNEQRTIIAGIKTHLPIQPDVVSNRKKQLRPNAIAPWELRIDIYSNPQLVVNSFAGIHSPPPEGGTTIHVQII